MKIESKEDYENAKSKLKEMFNTDACLVDMHEANSLMRAMDCFERDQARSKCTESIKRKEQLALPSNLSVKT